MLEENFIIAKDLRGQIRQEAEVKIWRGIKQATGKKTSKHGYKSAEEGRRNSNRIYFKDRY